MVSSRHRDRSRDRDRDRDRRHRSRDRDRDRDRGDRDRDRDRGDRDRDRGERGDRDRADRDRGDRDRGDRDRGDRDRGDRDRGDRDRDRDRHRDRGRSRDRYRDRSRSRSPSRKKEHTPPEIDGTKLIQDTLATLAASRSYANFLQAQGENSNHSTGSHESDSAAERRRKRPSRWGGSEHEKIFIPGMPTILPPNLNKDQEYAYLLQLQIEEVSRKLRSGDLGIPANPEERFVIENFYIVFQRRFSLGWPKWSSLKMAFHQKSPKVV